MSKLAETFRNRLISALNSRGSRADLVRKSGISGPVIDHWVAGRRVPDLNQVSATADAIGCPAIDLLFPGELPKPVVTEPTPEQAIEVLRKALDQDDLGAHKSGPARANSPAAAPLSPVKRAIVERLSSLDDDEARRYLGNIDAYLAAKSGALASPKKRDKA